jgi:hypothetical protein
MSDYNGWTNYATWKITESGAPAHVADLALAFIADVDWYEIADHLIQSENVA